MHQHGHWTVLLFLLIIKNYRIQDTRYSEVDSKCEVDSFSRLQILRGKHRVVGRHMAWSREWLAEQNLVRSSPEPSSLSLFALVNSKALTQGSAMKAYKNIFINIRTTDKLFDHLQKQLNLLYTAFSSKRDSLSDDYVTFTRVVLYLFNIPERIKWKYWAVAQSVNNFKLPVLR